MAFAILMRVPFWGTPLTSDEGGYAEVARLWEHSGTLYRDIWVDRPQGLILIFRGILHLGGGSPEVMRAVAAGVAALAVLSTMLLTRRLAGRITAVVSGLLMATVGASPFLESFTLSGELLASLVAICSLLAFVHYLERGRYGLLALAGLLTGCAMMIKQSGFDAGLATLLFLAVTRRREAVRPIGIFIAAAAVPVSLCALTAPFNDWWYAVVTYRVSGDSVATGSFLHRLALFGISLGPAAKGLALLALLAALGWRRAPLLVKLWLGTSALGVVGGGSFHFHYYIQLVAPLSVLAGIGALRLARVPRAVGFACAGVAAATLVFTVPLWFASAHAQTKKVWPRDHHLVYDKALVSYIKAHTGPAARIFLLWADADVYYLANRDPALQYLWERNIAAVPGALSGAQSMLAQQIPSLVVEVQKPHTLDKTGRTARILKEEYRLIAVVESVPIYRPLRNQPLIAPE